jgi:hypothetical protein
MSNGGDKAHHPAPAGAVAKTADAAKSGSKASKPTSTAKPRTK